MAQILHIKMRIPRRLKWLAIVVVSWFILHCIYITIDGFHNYEGRADVAVVLGNTVFKDSSASPWLKGRLDKALQLYREGRVRKIFVSGGKGEYGVPEGTGMKRYLLIQQVPDSVIISDNGGNNTYLTAKDFIKLNDSLHFSSAIVVTSFYHISRSKFIIRKLGFSEVHGVHSDAYFREDGFKLFREFAAFYKYLLLY